MGLFTDTAVTMPQATGSCGVGMGKWIAMMYGTAMLIHVSLCGVRCLVICCQSF